MLILQWEFWLGSGIALMLGAALGRLWCSRALAVAEDDLAALEEVLWYRMRVERQIREALGLGDIGSTIEAVRDLACKVAPVGVQTSPVPEILAEFRNCETCYGTGEVHSHNPVCWDCHGRGYVEARLTTEAHGNARKGEVAHG